MNLLRKAIVYELNPEKVITNGTSSPEEVAEALFVSHETIKELVSELKVKFSLDDELNPGWKEQISAASKKSQKYEKLESRKRKRAEKKQKIADEKKRLEWLKENKTEGSETNEEKQPVATLISKEKTIVPPKVKKPKKVQSFTVDEVNDLEEHPVTKKPKITKPITPFKAAKGELLKSPVKELEEEADEYEAEEDERSNEAMEEDEKMIDPFFTTSSGELRYLIFLSAFVMFRS